MKDSSLIPGHKCIHLIGIFFLSLCSLQAQNPQGFEQEVALLEQRYDSLWNPKMRSVVFTGSSSIRMWKELDQRFPESQIINTGFGGSEASDLKYYLQRLVLQYKPSQVFIYEGDNDIASGKRPRKIKKTLLEIFQSIQGQLPGTEMYFISAKPSISRWKLRRRYRRLNRIMLNFSKEADYLDFIDVWNPMLNGKKLRSELFITDGLHMNKTGYEIWYKAIAPKVKSKRND